MCANHSKNVNEDQGGKSAGKKSAKKSAATKKTKKETPSKSGKKQRSIKSKISLDILNNIEDEKDKQPKNEKAIKAIGPYEQCNICGSLCERTGHIQCAECEDFHICLSCFCRGYEKPLPKASSFVPIEKNMNHKNTHKYIPIGVNSMPLFARDWTAEQELLLLDGLGKYGLGNWKQIAELVNMSSGPPKTSANCQKHYYDVYINTNNPPMPDLNNIILDGEVKFPKSTSSSAVVEDDEEDKTPSGDSPSSKPQTFGYWPLRGDFDVEYDNDAELILADMEFRDDDTPQQKELKLSVIEIYNAKLDERIYRKRIIIERGLLDSKTLQQKERKLTTEERELHNLLRPFSRFHSPESHEQLVHLLVQERKIRSRLYQLLLWRSLGLESVQDVYDFEYERTSKKRQYELSSRVISSINIKERANKNKSGYKKEGASSSATSSASTPTSGEYMETEPAFDNKDRIIAECLDQKDIDFCKTINIPPIVFFIAKRVLLEEIITNPLISIDEKVKKVDLNVTKHGRLFDFILNLTPQSGSKTDETESVADLSNLPLDDKGNVDSSCISSEILPSK